MAETDIITGAAIDIQGAYLGLGRVVEFDGFTVGADFEIRVVEIARIGNESGKERVDARVGKTQIQQCEARGVGIDDVKCQRINVSGCEACSNQFTCRVQVLLASTIVPVAVGRRVIIPSVLQGIAPHDGRIETNVGALLGVASSAETACRPWRIQRDRGRVVGCGTLGVNGIVGVKRVEGAQVQDNVGYSVPHEWGCKAVGIPACLWLKGAVYEHRSECRRSEPVFPAAKDDHVSVGLDGLMGEHPFAWI